jgi:transcriptional regulator with XRE-family HTH domain
MPESERRRPSVARPGGAGTERSGIDPDGRAATAEPVVNLGASLRSARQASGLSLRELARQLSVSPSFLSQLETGKSQPSVATLYSIAQVLDLSIDELFAAPRSTDQVVVDAIAASPAAVAIPAPTDGSGSLPISRSTLGSPADAWPHTRGVSRLSVTRPGDRRQLQMDSGVIWEQLATNTGMDLDFMEIIYPPHSTSTNDKRMLQHAGSEFGYLLEGELEITVGFDVFTLHAGEAIGFDSSTPHLLANTTDVPARGIWVVQHPRQGPTGSSHG